MKTHVLFLRLILALAASSLAVHASVCSDSTIKGNYAFTIRGQIIPPDGSAPIVIHGVAETRFDGVGNLVQRDAVAANGLVSPGWRLSTGTYSVNPDCTGEMTVTNGDQPPVHIQLIVAQSGNTLHVMVIDPGFATTAEAERIHAPKK